MKKILALLLCVCLIFAASPLCVGAVSASPTFSANVEREIYYTEDVFTLTLDLSNNSKGFSSLRGRLNYDSENLTLKSIACDAPFDEENEARVSISYSLHNGYIQILWTVGSGLVNYALDTVIAEFEFTVNKDAENKTYNFDFEYLDGTRYTYGASFKDTDWEYITDVETVGDSFMVDTSIDSMLYFENAPTGAYIGENVTLDIAFFGRYRSLYL